VRAENHKLPILTIGYGLRGGGEVIELLRRYGVEYVGDVRSVPFSRRRPEFSRPALERILQAAEIRYVFLGDVLGGRPEDPRCYDDDGHVDYDRCRDSDTFRTGIDRVEAAHQQGRCLALLCSEARPEDCHRTKLLAEMLAERGVSVRHINEHGNLVEHEEIAAKIHGAQLTLVAGDLGRSRRAYRVA
jgi:uncharacterized protein (DUF488 family)